MSNLALRTISGVGFIAVMLCGLLFNEYLFAALAIFMLVGMLHEFYKMTMQNRHKVGRGIAIGTGVTAFALIFAVCAWGLDPRFAAISIAPVSALLISAIFSEDKAHLDDYAYILAGLLYIAMPLALSSLVAFSGGSFSGMLLLCFFVLIWCSDIGAYVVGLALGKGKKKMAPVISPKKTWVGFFGGIAFCIAAAFALRALNLIDLPWYHCLALALIIDLGGVCGDLFESLWKRHFGVKDSGNIIPGHGGLLDRFDSTLVAMPLGAIYLSIVGLL